MHDWTLMRKLVWLKASVLSAVAAVYQTVTGAIVSFVTVRAAPIKTLVVNVDPVQDLHGYASPWPPGGGKNKVKNMAQGYWAFASGAWTGSGVWVATYPKIPCKPDTDYVASWSNGYQTRWQGFVWYDENGDYISTTNWSETATNGKTAKSPNNAAYLAYNVAGKTSSTTIVPSDLTNFQIEEGTTATAYAPYSNICPISGWTGCKVWVQPTHDTSAQADYNISWQTEAGTVYGGTLTVNEDGSGVLKSRPYYASYNGETLVGPWVSSMDKYVSGATPTTGAQVVDLGGTETSTNLTPGQVTALLGQNYVWADTGDVSVTYRSN